MLSALAMAAALSVVGASASTPQDADVAALVRQACVETGMERTAFERLGRERGWRPGRAGGAGGAWTSSLRAPGAILMLARQPDVIQTEATVGALCSVSVDRAGPGVVASVEALATELGLEAEPAFEDPGAGSMRIWSKIGVYTLTYATGATGDPRVVVSLSRQAVSSSPETVSPSGN